MQQPVYITRPERIIWPVILFVAATLFSGALEATLSRVVVMRWAERPAVEAPVGAVKAPAQERSVARHGQQKLVPDARILLRRAAIIVRLPTAVVEGHVFQVKSRRQLVVSPRPGGLVRYFPTAPPRDTRFT